MNEDVELYNKIDKYSKISDTLYEEINLSQEITIKEKEGILYPIVEEIKKDSENLSFDYINYLKEKTDEKKEKIQKNIELIIEKIDMFKNQVYEIYLKHNKNN